MTKILTDPSALGAGFRVYADPRRDTPDPNDINAVLETLNRAFEVFKEENDKNIADLKKGQEDVVRSEKLERIDASIADLQAIVDTHVAQLAALSVGGPDASDPDVRAHAEAFDTWFRSGVDNGLGDLEIRAELTTQSDPDGGFLVPEEMETAIEELLRTESAMRQLATVRRMGAQTFKKLVNKGGATSGWVGEDDERANTDTPTLSALEFDAKEIYAQPAATQTMLDDSNLNIEGWLADEVEIELAEQEGAAFISGNVPTRPRGLLSYGTVANADWEWGKLGFIVSGNGTGFADRNPGDALIDLIHGLKPGYRQNGTFLMNDKTLSEIRKMKDGQNNYLWQPSFQQGQPSTLIAYPVATDDHMPDIGANAFPIGFGDFRRGYLILDRAGIRVLRDPLTSKPYVKFYTTKRVAGGVQNYQAIKLLKIAG